MTKFLPLYKTRYRCELENPQERADILYHMREYRDQWHKNKHLPGFETFKNASDEAVYINMLQRRLKEKGWKINHHPDIEVMFIQATLDDAWCDLQRPYYNVWPKILQSLLRLDLSKVPSESLEPSYEPLALRLPESVSFSMGRCQDRLDITQAVVGCLFAFLPAPEKYKDGALSRFLCVLQCKTSDGRILNGGYSVTLRKGCTVEQCIQQGLEDAGGWGIDEELRTETAENLLKLAICTRMLRQDSEFLTKAFIDLTDAQQTALLKDKRAL
ncbi:hypothetical protein KC906_01930, partial [Candidatus Kaiserbacteria bacterium]|nr:hypothetical protein [Candidatus Kaiserbacteria bacterium]